jgi:hypothetical protein
MTRGSPILVWVAEAVVIPWLGGMFLLIQCLKHIDMAVTQLTHHTRCVITQERERENIT